MADVRNLSSEELENQKNLLKEQELIQARIEERNKRMAIAGQEEIKRLKKRNEQDKENLKSLEDKTDVFDDIEDAAKDYVKFWEKAGERQEEYLDMVEGFQTSFAKLGNDVKKVLTSSTFCHKSHSVIVPLAGIAKRKKKVLSYPATGAVPAVKLC